MPLVKRDWTVDERDALPDDGNRYEVIDGELFVTPAPAIRHQAAVVRLVEILNAYLRRERLGYALVAPVDVVFSPRRGVQPDVVALPPVNGRWPGHFNDVRRLLLAAEVLSPTTARVDRVGKRQLYREEGVPEYWIVDLDARTFERTTPADPRAEILSGWAEWRPDGAREPLVIDLAEYFADVLDR